MLLQCNVQPQLPLTYFAAGVAGQQSTAGSNTVGAWLTQSLAAIKRRGRSTDDAHLRAMPPAAGNEESAVHHQTLLDGLPPQGHPAHSTSNPPGQDTAQHAQHTQQAGPAKRKPGRPRKVPQPQQQETAGSNSPGNLGLPLSSPVTGATNFQPLQGLQGLPDVQLTLSPVRHVPLGTVADNVPAGALVPRDDHSKGHKRSNSVQIDVSKLPKSRNKHQGPNSKASGSGSTPPAEGLASGAIVPGAATAMPSSGQPSHMDGHVTAPEAATAQPEASAVAEQQPPSAAAATAAALAPSAAEVADGTASEVVKEAAAAAAAGEAKAKGTALGSARAQHSEASAVTLSALASPASPTAPSGKLETVAKHQYKAC